MTPVQISVKRQMLFTQSPSSLFLSCMSHNVSANNAMFCPKGPKSQRDVPKGSLRELRQTPSEDAPRESLWDLWHEHLIPISVSKSIEQGYYDTGFSTQRLPAVLHLLADRCLPCQLPLL